MALEAGTFPEVANAGAYARQTLNPMDANWTAPDGTGGLTNNVFDITYPQATADWGWVWGLIMLDSATYGEGNPFMYGPLTTPQEILNTNQFKFAIGDMNVTFA